MAQIRQYCGPKLQYFLSHKHWLWSKPSLSDFSLLGSPRRNTQIAGTRNNIWSSSHRNVLNPSLFYYITDPHTRPRCRILWRWLNATYSIPLFLRILDCPSTIHSPIHACTNLSHHLRTRCSLHVTPKFKNSTVGDAVTNSCRLSQQSDARVGKEISLGGVRTSHEVLHAKESTAHFILPDQHSIQIDDELFAGSHGPTYNESCLLEDLEKGNDLILAQTVTRLYHL